MWKQTAELGLEKDLRALEAQLEGLYGQD